MAPANEVERRRWNDPFWTAIWPAREALTSAVTPYLLEALAPQPGERILDVGSGGGTTTLRCAQAVQPDGAAMGADISTALVALAQQRAEATQTERVSFTVADMQTDRLDQAPFDAATSQFGVMFFDEPVRAMANIRTHLRRRGRFVFACWQAVERNPWHIGTALRALVPPTPPPEPGRSAPGPFTLADPNHCKALLSAAGFVDFGFATHEREVEAPASAVVDSAQFDFMRIPADQHRQAQALSEAHLNRFRIGPDRFRYPLAFQIVSVINP